MPPLENVPLTGYLILAAMDWVWSQSLLHRHGFSSMQAARCFFRRLLASTEKPPKGVVRIVGVVDARYRRTPLKRKRDTHDNDY